MREPMICGNTFHGVMGLSIGEDLLEEITETTRVSRKDLEQHDRIRGCTFKGETKVTFEIAP